MQGFYLHQPEVPGAVTPLSNPCSTQRPVAPLPEDPGVPGDHPGRERPPRREQDHDLVGDAVELAKGRVDIAGVFKDVRDEGSAEMMVPPSG